MKDCEKCGEAFENKTKYSRVCEDCKYEVADVRAKKLRGKSNTAYWERDDFITKK